MVCPYNKTSYPASRRAPTRSSSYLGGESGDTASAILVCARARCGICLSPRPVRQRSRPQRYIRISPPFSTMGCSWTCLSSKRPSPMGAFASRAHRSRVSRGRGRPVDQSKPYTSSTGSGQTGRTCSTNLRLFDGVVEDPENGLPAAGTSSAARGGRFALAPSKGSVNKENGCRDEGTLDFTIVVEHTVAS